MTLPTDPAARKAVPIYSGFIKYFPRAICAVAELSRIGNDQHNPGQPLHWDRNKSQDELDALMRHLVDDAMGVPTDTDNILHATKLAWRAMANLEKALEARGAEHKPDLTEQLPPGSLREVSHEGIWKTHTGNGLPLELVNQPKLIHVMFRSNKVALNQRSEKLLWMHHGLDGDITAWRLAGCDAPC